MSKKHKVFVESKDTALLLAESITGLQEEKVLTKKKKNQVKREDLAKSRRPRSSKSDRIESAKAAIVVQKNQARKDKTRKRAAVTQRPEGDVSTAPKKKGVTFA